VARETRQYVLLPSVRLDPLADPHRPSVPALFSKLDAVAPSLARLLPEPLPTEDDLAAAITRLTVDR
jgi:hypothetical protein